MYTFSKVAHSNILAPCTMDTQVSVNTWQNDYRGTPQPSQCYVLCAFVCGAHLFPCNFFLHFPLLRLCLFVGSGHLCVTRRKHQCHRIKNDVTTSMVSQEITYWNTTAVNTMSQKTMCRSSAHTGTTLRKSMYRNTISVNTMSQNA